jgi:hypothetical protein
MVREPFGQSEPEDNPQDGGVVIVGGEEPGGITAPAGSSSRPGVVTPAPDEQNQQPGGQQPD